MLDINTATVLGFIAKDKIINNMAIENIRYNLHFQRISRYDLLFSPIINVRSESFERFVMHPLIH